MKFVYINLGGIILKCELVYEDAADYFHGFATDSVSDAPSARVTEMDWAFWKRNHALIDPHLEFSSLTGSCSDVLLQYGRCAFHAVALKKAGRAWLIAAESGVGKTTQLRTLQTLYPGQFSVICGDRPILELRKDGGVYVHPSPWNGKEEYGGAAGAPLAGVICLSRGRENEVKAWTAHEAGPWVYKSVIQTAESEDGIRRAAAFATELLKRVPVWEMTTHQVPDSTKLLYETLWKGEK